MSIKPPSDIVLDVARNADADIAATATRRRSVKRLRLNCEGVSRRIGGFVHDFGRWRKGRASGVVGQGVQLADRRSVSNIRQRICDGCAAVGVG